MRRKKLTGVQFLSSDGGAVVGTCVSDLGVNGVVVKGNDGVVFVVPQSLITVTVSYSIPYTPEDVSISGGLSDSVELGEATEPVAPCEPTKPTDEKASCGQTDKPSSVSGRRKMLKDCL